MSIKGDRGRRKVDRVDKMAVRVFSVLLVRQSFMWFDEFGGSVIVE